MAAEDDAETGVRVEANADVRNRDVGILTDFLSKVKATYNGLKREMVGAEEDTKEKAERSREEVEVEEKGAKEKEEAALQDMIQAEVEYWESQERSMIEEYSREKAEAETEFEATTREKEKGIERVRAEYEAKARAEDDMRKQVWRAKSHGLRNDKNS